VFDNIAFQPVSGSDTRRRIRLLALSTCGFCRRGQEFLEKHNFAYEFVHLDTLDAQVKAAVKQEFKDKFGESLSYPALVIDNSEHTIGYVKRFWEDLLKVPHEDDQGAVP
jgi:glutaredoxin